MNKKGYILLFVAIVLMIVAIISGFLGSGQSGISYISSKISKTVNKKSDLTLNYVNKVTDKLSKGTYISFVEDEDFLEKNNITVFIYENNQLKFWSDNNFDVDINYNHSLFDKPVVSIQNGRFIPFISLEGNYIVIGLLKITSEYGYENDVIKSGFVDELNVGDDVVFNTEKLLEEQNVYNKKGEFLFSVSSPTTSDINSFRNITLILWCLTLLAIALLLVNVAGYHGGRKKSIVGVVVCFVVLALIYAISILLQKPTVFYDSELFSPLVFKFNSFIPSLGHVLYIGISLFLTAIVFYRNVQIDYSFDKESLKGEIIVGMLFIAGTALICFGHAVLTRLLIESNISFEIYKLFDLDIFSLFACIAVLLIFFSSFWLFLKGLKTDLKLLSKGIIAPFILSLAMVVLFFHDEKLSVILVSLLLIVQLLFARLIVYKSANKFVLSLTYAVVVSIYALLEITILSERRITENIKTQAFSFSIENDMKAEQLLLDMWPEMLNDETLSVMMSASYFDNELYIQINDYLHDRYFDGYWGNYNISVYLCESNQPLLLEQTGDNQVNCFDFFEGRIREQGSAITGTDFYFIDNKDGRTCYLGKLFFDNDYGSKNGLFIEFFSDVNVFQPGYSELLLDKDYHGYAGLRDYSFAKYIKGQAVLTYGDYDYQNSDEEYVQGVSEYREFVEENYKHILYRNGETTVVISRSVVSKINIFTSFAYLFAFTFLLVNLSIFLTIGFPVDRGIVINLRAKFQIAIIGILLVSSVFVGFFVTNMTINSYKTNHYEIIKEKMGSVWMALDFEYSTTGYRLSDNDFRISLSNSLIDLSNILNTDINIYDLEGYLIATSRPEIFNRDLVSMRINSDVLVNMIAKSKTEYIHEEKLGNMNYLSGYAPYYDSDGQVIGYLNLPYFRMQNNFAKEISDLVVTVINFTLILILIIMVIAVLIVGKLTSPLSMLSRGLASVELGRKAEHINYEAEDEIGELIKQYNLMVDELDESAVKLANSEREYAWREMAKQIAHEIKNPLTPMKLNVQQLLRSYKDKVNDFDQRMEVFAKNQVEYIDNLSSIASAFSSFAKMPRNNPVQVDLIEQLQTTLDIFHDTRNVTFEEVWPEEKKVFIYADKEHLNGIFSNLLKNAIQAIPLGRQGVIKVTLRVLKDKTIVMINDNGTGIPNIIRDKLFTPNFTTKSSGTGLGLSIVKRYVENAGGSIWFESTNAIGTTFFVEFPLMFTVERL